jgi:hypothetical protein
VAKVIGTALQSAKPWVQIPVPPKEPKAKQNVTIVRTTSNLSFCLFHSQTYFWWIFFLFSFLAVLGFELRTLCLLGRCSTTWDTSS